MRICKYQFLMHCNSIFYRNIKGPHLSTFFIKNGSFYICIANFLFIKRRYFQIVRYRGTVPIELVCAYSDITKMQIRYRKHRNIPEDSNWCPVIITIKIRTFTFSIYPDSKSVNRIIVNKTSNIKQAGIESGFPFTGIFSVYPNIITIQYAVKPKKRMLSFPLTRYNKCCAM